MANPVNPIGPWLGVTFLYGLLVVGILLLVAEALGRLRARPARARVLRFGGAAAALVLGGLPGVALLTGRIVAGGPEAGLLAVGFGLGGIAVVAGAFRAGAGARPGAAARRLRRLGYLALLVFTAVPSSMSLPLAVLVPLAGLALVDEAGAP